MDRLKRIRSFGSKGGNSTNTDLMDGAVDIEPTTEYTSMGAEKPENIVFTVNTGSGTSALLNIYFACCMYSIFINRLYEI